MLILDSPFMSFKKLCTDIGKAKFKLPEVVQELTFKTLKAKIEEKTGYNLFAIDLENLVMVRAL